MYQKIIWAAIFLVALSSVARAEYVKAKPGNEQAKAEAYCNMVARGSRQGFIAFGSSAYVAGAAIGNEIDNMIRQSMTKKDCMRYMGYEWVKKKGKPTNRRPLGYTRHDILPQ